MGIKSKSNWSGTIVNGVLLGEPAQDETTLEYHWDGGVPHGFIDVNGDFQPDGFLEDGVTKPPKVEFVKMPDVKLVEPKMTETGQVDPTRLYLKEDLVTFNGVTYRCNKDGIAFDPASKDWAPLKTAVVKG